MNASDPGSFSDFVDSFAGRGVFVVLEGLDGTGTTTQAAILSRLLIEHGIPNITTNEPSSGLIGSVTRAAIDLRTDLHPAALALAFAADRVDHIYNRSNGILHTLERGTWVICDRYVLSSLAYQAAQGIDVEWLKSINLQAITPDVTIFIDTPVATCAERIVRRDSHSVELFHNEDRLAAVQGAYITVLRSSASLLGHLITADGSAPIDVVAKQIESGLMTWLSIRSENLDRKPPSLRPSGKDELPE